MIFIQSGRLKLSSVMSGLRTKLKFDVTEQENMISPIILSWKYCRFSLYPSFSTNQSVFDTNAHLLLHITDRSDIHPPQRETGGSQCNTTPAPLLSPRACSPCNIYNQLVPCVPEPVHLPPHRPPPLAPFTGPGWRLPVASHYTVTTDPLTLTHRGEGRRLFLCKLSKRAVALNALSPLVSACTFLCNSCFLRRLIYHVMYCVYIYIYFVFISQRIVVFF